MKNMKNDMKSVTHNIDIGKTVAPLFSDKIGLRKCL